MDRLLQTFRHIVIMIAGLSIALAFPACTGRSSIQALERAEQLIEEDPDSALTIVEGIEESSLRSSRYRAKYAILKTQALIKNDSIVTDPGLIRQAVDYYMKKGDSPELMKALFYHAEVLRNMENLTSAVKSSTHAYDLANRFGDNYWIAKSAEQLMFIFTASFNRKESQRYAIIASENYKKAGKIINHLYSLCDICIGYDNAGEYERAKQLVDSVISILPSDAGENLIAYCHQVRFPVCSSLEEYEEANISLYELKKQIDFKPLPPQLAAIEADLWYRTGNKKRASELLDSVSLIYKDTRSRVSLYETLIYVLLLSAKNF